jgi:hypothetical protein
MQRQLGAWKPEIQIRFSEIWKIIRTFLRGYNLTERLADA